MWKTLSSIAFIGAGIANAQLPPLTLTDGSAPSSVEAPWHCDPTGPPSIGLTADSSGITMTMTYYREALTDDQGTPADRAVHTSGFFKLKSGDNRLTYEGNDWITNAGALDTGYYTTSQDFIGLCDSADSIAFSRDNIFAHGGLTRGGATCGAVPTNATIYADADCDPISSEAYCSSVDQKNSNEWIIQAVETAEAGQNCTAKYTATFTKTINEFEVLGGQDQIVTVQSEAGVRQLTWDFYTLELAEPGVAGGTVAARYTKHSFLTDFSTTAAVTIAIDSSDVLPPLFLQVVSVEGNRVLASPTVGVLDFKLHVYVRQGEGSGAVEPIYLNAIDTPVVTSSAWPETAGAATVVCEAIVYDDEANSPNAYYEYAEGTRTEIGANDLPPSIQVRSPPLQAPYSLREYILFSQVLTSVLLPIPFFARKKMQKIESAHGRDGNRCVSQVGPLRCLPPLYLHAFLGYRHHCRTSHPGQHYHTRLRALERRHGFCWRLCGLGPQRQACFLVWYIHYAPWSG